MMLTRDGLQATADFIDMIANCIHNNIPASNRMDRQNVALDLIAEMADSGYGLIAPDRTESVG